MRRSASWAVVCAALAGPAAAAPAETPSSPNELAWRTVGVWRQPQGLPQNTVRVMLQTRDGYLWVGTNGGVSRFDGVRFTTFDDRDPKQLRESEVWGLAEGPDETLWIGTYGGGLSRLQHGRFTVYTTADGLVDNFVSTVCVDVSGAVWIGTDKGLSRLQSGTFTTFKKEDGLGFSKVRSLWADPDGSVWIGASNGGIRRFHRGRLEAEVPGLPALKGEVRAFVRSADGALWIATQDGLWRVKDGKATRYGVEDGLASDSIHSVHTDIHGDLWIATDEGLNRYHDGRLFAHRVTYEAPYRQAVTAVLTDSEGGLWVGSWSQGLAHLRQGQFVTWASPDGLPADYVSSVLQDRDGRIWVGTTKGLGVYDDKALKMRAVPLGMPLNVTSLAEDGKGHLLIGTRTGVYALATREACAACRVKPALVGKDATLYARVVFVDRAGTIWIGTDNAGLVHYYRGKFTTYTTLDGLGSDAVRAIAQDASGALWIGTKGGGLDRFQDGRFTAFRQADGLPEDNAYSVLVDGDVLWFTTRHGLVRRKDGRFVTLTAADGLYTNFIYNLVEDGDDFWMSGATGIFRVSKRELNERADGKRRMVTSVAYGLEHGLGGVVGTIGHQPGALKARDGRIWFATADGVAAIRPGELRPPASLPRVHIEELEVDQRPVALAGGVRLPPGRGDLTFRYTGLSLLAPDKMQFRYRLEPYETEWREAGTRRVAYYTNIPPGDYVFRVIACNNDGQWNESGASLDLHLAPHFYRTRAFVLACVAALLVLVFAVHQVRVRAIAAQKARLEILVGDRTRELSAATRQLDLANRDLERRVAEGIGALREAERMAAYGQLIAAVAHEVRHPVFALQAASHVLRDRLQLEEELAPQLRTLDSETNRLNVLMSDLLDFARPPELHLAPATATDLFAEAADVFHDEGHAGVRVVTDVEPGLPRLCVDRFRIVQALLNLMRNAVNHAGGLTRLTLSACRPPDGRYGVRISVGDDGSGIRPELLQRIFEPFVTSGKGTGLGLSIARRVATAHQGEVSVESEVGHGTTFHLDLPPAADPVAASAAS